VTLKVKKKVQTTGFRMHEKFFSHLFLLHYFFFDLFLFYYNFFISFKTMRIFFSNFILSTKFYQHNETFLKISKFFGDFLAF